MATRTSRAASTARQDILDTLKEDHKRVRKAYKDFQKLDVESDRDACETLVRQVLQELTVHATLEEELLYPAARDALREPGMIDEAEVEHESLHVLIDQLQGMGPDDEKFAARFTVLCEYVQHHVKEEEGEMFPELENVKLDWEALSAAMQARRGELTGEEADADKAIEQAPGGQSDDAPTRRR